jgi:hypothetical protein
VGYLGVGEFKGIENKKIIQLWASLLYRCYGGEISSYIGCFVCSDWHNFQNFARWFKQSNYQEGWHLDKDIVVKGNKTYCPEYCSFVPQEINKLFIKGKSKRGLYPIGVCFLEDRNKFLAKEHNRYLGLYETSEEAFTAYKEYKEKLLKEKAEQYKDLLEPKIYNSLISYKVDIND